MRILKSPSNDPAVNFALEHTLLTECDGDFLLFYINAPAVVVGRNQSEAAEADLEYCRLHGIPVLRRISGGGTVYHDGGNVNFSFISARGTEPLLDSRPHRPIVDALAGMGVEAVVGVRGELLTGGKKISGTASCIAGRRQLFHGTLLYDTDIEKMGRALRGNAALRGRKIASVPSETVNLKSLLPRFDGTREFLDALAAAVAVNCNTDKPETLNTDRWKQRIS